MMVILYPLLFGVAVVLLVGIFGGVLLEKHREYQASQALEEQKLKKLNEVRAEIEAVESKQRRFRNDPEFLTRVGHEQGFVAPHEIRVDFDDPDGR